jgi:ElaB/YqjD/DUF883 family membrane-anchored ribosome-binding protein
VQNRAALDGPTAARGGDWQRDERRENEMAETKTDNVESIEDLDAVKKALDAAQRALDSARSSMDEASSGAKSVKRKLADGADELLEQAKNHLNEAKESMAELAAKGRKQAEVLYDATSEQYSELADRARELRDKAKDTLADLELGRRRKDVIDFVRKNPGTSALIALAVGFLGGYLARKRN